MLIKSPHPSQWTAGCEMAPPCGDDEEHWLLTLDVVSENAHKRNKQYWNPSVRTTAELLSPNTLGCFYKKRKEDKRYSLATMKTSFKTNHMPCLEKWRLQIRERSPRAVKYKKCVCFEERWNMQRKSTVHAQSTRAVQHYRVFLQEIMCLLRWST